MTRKLLALLLCAASARAQENAAEPAPPPPGAPARDAAASPLTGDELTPELQAAVQRGLAWLAGQQGPDGDFGGGGGGQNLAFGALAGVALMSAGNLPNRGPYGLQVARCVDYVLDQSDPSGLLGGAQGGQMYVHGFATLFLAEVYGASPDPRLREALTRAIRLIERTQNAEGGWRYQPAPVDADTSVTICQVMALRAARDAGIKVEKAVIDKAVAYVKRMQNADGGFSYASVNSGSAFPRSAAGVATLFYSGLYDGPEIDRGLAYVARFTPGRAPRESSHYYYGQYYAVQCMFLAGGEHWARWFPAARQELLAQQAASGSWPGDDYGPVYSTAMALIVLQMPNRYLPVFSGKGPGS